MTTQPEQPKQDITCPSCAYTNGAWRSQCESCGAALRPGATRYTTDIPTRARSPWSWVMGVVALLRLAMLLVRCASDSTPSYTPSYTSNYDSTAFTSPLAPDSSLALDPMALGQAVFANQTISVVHPLLWSAHMSDPTTVEMEGLQTYMQIGWDEDQDAAQLLQTKQTTPTLFQAAEVEMEQALRTQFSGEGHTLISFARHEQAELDQLPLLFGAYEASVSVDFETIDIVHFVTLCAQQRICIFQYGRAGSQPLTPSEWDMLAQIAASLRFVDGMHDGVAPTGDGSLQPLSPLLEMQQGGNL